MRTIINMLAVSAILVGVSATRAADPTPPGGVNEVFIKTILADDGYDVKAKRDSNGDPYLSVALTRKKLDINVTVEISPNRAKVWMYTSFAGMPTADKLSGPELMKLLKYNSTGVGYISIDEATHKIYLRRPFDNRGVNRATLTTEMEKFAEDVLAFESIWKELRNNGVANNR